MWWHCQVCGMHVVHHTSQPLPVAYVLAEWVPSNVCVVVVCVGCVACQQPAHGSGDGAWLH